ncbi:MAG: prephenate dehydrogenase/arogenate dehydrogenase family protein [Deltaproteobacteria bacterium]|nr:prephenate dehydrogenase/arogenate dehydrogenase family protein [Deltaproteobacteria bacterium]MBW2067727.1 prephenate dehydrogenase/arogenate dehydrogenase family protein [Deltaproteobacteria bacterium]
MNGSLLKLWGPGSTLGIVGGRGEMGQFFANFFRKRGYRVIISDPKGSEYSNEELISEAKVVLFSVPLHESVSILERYSPMLKEDQLAVDISSLKGPQIRAMLKGSSAVVGLHPMFGGKIRSTKGQTIVACPARIEQKAWEAFKGQFEAEGFRVVECSPDKHDRMMAIIQVLFHLSTMLKGRVLREMDVNIDDTLQFTSPIYRLEISILGRMFAQNPWLYAAIFQMNPHTPEVIEHLQKGIEHFKTLYKNSDISGVVEQFCLSADHLGSFCQKAYKESSELVEFSNRLYNNV